MLLGWSMEKVGANFMVILPRIAAERRRVGKRQLIWGGLLIDFDPRTRRGCATHRVPVRRVRAAGEYG